MLKGIDYYYLTVDQYQDFILYYQKYGSLVRDVKSHELLAYLVSMKTSGKTTAEELLKPYNTTEQINVLNDDYLKVLAFKKEFDL